MMPRKVFNLERDVRTTIWVVDKIRGQETYAQNFYAALCNNQYQPIDVWGILKNINWDCSWRYAADMISDIRQDGSYDNWYGSGFTGTDFAGFVQESYVTEEIEADLNTIGWVLLTKRFVN
jgi:hypothetical protein